MVGCGTAMLGVACLVGMRHASAGDPRVATSRGSCALRDLVAPLGLVALEAGWVVTEVGRQPWIVHGVMRTATR